MRSRCCCIGKWVPSEGIVLTEESLAIIQETSKNIALIAGPGAGKTELLAQRANFLLQTGACQYPKKILALCFKVDAAANIRERVNKRCSGLLVSRFKSLTFDAFFISIIRRFYTYLPKWLNTISPDFYVEPFSVNWWRNYRNVRLNGAKNSYQSNYSPLNLNQDLDSSLIDIWQYCMENNTYDYDMCRSMAYTIIKNSPAVRSLITSTYKYVFLDEFQDTTEHQYSFIKEIFDDSETVITAVGDTKQMIMGWAGADIYNFKKFSKDFNAEKKHLLINHRSNQTIIKLINSIAAKITPKNEENSIYRGTRSNSDSEKAIMAGSFESINEEVSAISIYIKNLLNNNSNLKPSDFALILRQNAKNYFQIANSAFLRQGIRLRNEDKLACPEGVKVQDLMDEILSKFFINLIRKKENLIKPEQKKELIYLIAEIEYFDIDNERSYKKIIDKINLLVNLIDLSKPVSTWTNKVINKLGREKVRNMNFSYKSNKFTKVKISFDSLFQESLNKSDSIDTAIKNYEGENQVKLMTVHKSKGLEFDTVFFVDFNNSSWWGLEKAYKSQNMEKMREEINTFFVGLSRAKERLIFTNVNKQWPPLILNLLRDSNIIKNFDIRNKQKYLVVVEK